MLCGGLVFVAAFVEGIPLTSWVFGNPVGITAITAAMLSLILLWYFLDRDKPNLLRMLAGFQVTMILLTTTYSHYPNIVLLSDGQYLSLLEHQGNDKTIYALGMALLIGSVFILPALFSPNWICFFIFLAGLIPITFIRFSFSTQTLT